MKKGYTHIVTVLDRSGSMASTAEDAKGGFDTFIKGQKEAPGEATLTLAQFDTVYEIVHNGIRIQDVPPLVLEPRGMTAMLDAIGKTINETGILLKGKTEDERPEHVVFVIITDGMENASKEFTREKVLGMIQHQTDNYHWNFVYLGANQDAIAVGASMGIKMDAALTYTASAPRAAYGVMGQSLNALRAGTEKKMAFSPKQRKEARPKE